MKEAIIIGINEVDEYECTCGNTSFDDGFFPCDTNGKEIEPTSSSGWNGLYVCANCGLIHKVE